MHEQTNGGASKPPTNQPGKRISGRANEQQMEDPTRRGKIRMTNVNVQAKSPPRQSEPPPPFAGAAEQRAVLMPARDIFSQLLRLCNLGNLGGRAGGAPPAGGLVGSATGQVVASWLGWAFVLLPLDCDVPTSISHDLCPWRSTLNLVSCRHPPLTSTSEQIGHVAHEQERY